MPATIASYLPFELDEHKPGLIPGSYIIKQGDGQMKFSCTVIPDHAYYQINPDPLADIKDIRMIRVPVLAMELAQSIITDYGTAVLGAQPPDAMPGLLAVPGEHDERQMQTKYPQHLKTTREQQVRWFKSLVDMADDMWARSKSPLAIADLQRHAAACLDLKREWLFIPPPELVPKCPVCANVVHPDALMCVVCRHVLKPVEYAKVMADAQKADTKTAK